MKIALLSGSRSDRNALVMVEKALKVDGHDTNLIVFDDKHYKTVYATEPEDRVSHVVAIAADRAKDADLAIIHGDRHETLAAALDLNMHRFPIAHIGGGDITEGSQDDCFRHAITKLSHMHFASNRDAADRIVQMGEEPDRVHVTGCPGIDMVMATPTYGKSETFAAVGLDMVRMAAVQGFNRSLLVLFHPNTLGGTASELEALSVALARRAEALVLLGPNADAGGDLIRREWQRLAQNRPDTIYHDNVEPQVFYSLLRWCDVLVGNSSAGYYEAPCFGTRVINIGDRQKGRPSLADNVIQITPGTNAADIEYAIEVAHMGYPTVADRKPCRNVYGDGHAAERIAKVIGGIKDPRALLRKKFQDLDYDVEPMKNFEVEL